MVYANSLKMINPMDLSMRKDGYAGCLQVALRSNTLLSLQGDQPLDGNFFLPNYLID